MSTENKGRSFGASVLISFGFTGIFTVIALANSIIVARMVGAEGRGLYALGVSVLGLLAPFSTLGLAHSSTWAVGRGKPQSEIVTLNHLWSACVLLLGGGVSGGIFWWSGGLPESNRALVAMVAALTIPASVYAETTRGVLLGRKEVVRYHLVQAVIVVALLISNLTLLRLGPRAVLLALSLSYWLPAVGLLLLHVSKVRLASFPALEHVSEWVRYGLQTSATTMFENALLRLDYLLVSPLVGVAAIGLYSTADQISVILAWGGLIAGRMMLTESANDPTGEASRRKLGLAIRTLLVVVGLGTVGAAATGWFLIPLVFGEEFSAAYVGLLFLLPSAPIKGCYALISTYLLGRNAIRPVIIAGGAATLGLVVLSPLAAMRFGWVGVAAAKTLVLVVQMVLTVRAYEAETGEPIRWMLDGADVAALKNWAQSRLSRRS